MLAPQPNLSRPIRPGDPWRRSGFRRSANGRSGVRNGQSIDEDSKTLEIRDDATSETHEVERQDVLEFDDF
jgi:hypothetical protein